jgi:GH15 family glucan-1,4-alpha-glucosidase
MARMSRVPIADHALLSDRHGAALVTRDGSVDWLCVPRFDSSSVFGRLLDDDAGHWSIAAVDAISVSRRYIDRTMVLETTFETATGVLRLTDALCTGPGNRGHELGVDVPSLLLRMVACIEGEVEVAMEYVPRPEYGVIHPLLESIAGGVLAHGGADVLVLSSPVEVTIGGATGRARFGLTSGEQAAFALHHRKRVDRAEARLWSQDEIEERLDDTIAAWRSWSEIHQSYEGPWRDLVHHSGRVLQALSFQPTGAICAAATTSLPESEGGVRNWDYRYTWVRDASFTIGALWVAACPDEANEFFEYITVSAATALEREGDLQIMFGIGGERDLSERELPHLRGWRESAPVRIGNGAWNQRQIDVYGELLGAVHRLADRVPDHGPATRRFLVAVADAAARRWRDQDHGIWEVRGEPRDFVYSKVMCWFGLEHAIALADRLDARDRVPEWRRAQQEIHDAVVTKGWSDEAKAFTQSFGSTVLDASNLVMPVIGFLPPDDPRVLATIDAIAERLTDERGLVYRYRADDGLEGEEGTFLMCTFWLAEALAVTGQPERAREVFERAARFVNDVGLLAEEVDPVSGELLGNFPQAFSHIGLVNAAWAISVAEQNP